MPVVLPQQVVLAHVALARLACTQERKARTVQPSANRSQACEGGQARGPIGRAALRAVASAEQESELGAPEERNPKAVPWPETESKYSASREIDRREVLLLPTPLLLSSSPRSFSDCLLPIHTALSLRKKILQMTMNTRGMRPMPYDRRHTHTREAAAGGWEAGGGRRSGQRGRAHWAESTELRQLWARTLQKGRRSRQAVAW